MTLFLLLVALVALATFWALTRGWLQPKPKPKPGLVGIPSLRGLEIVESAWVPSGQFVIFSPQAVAIFDEGVRIPFGRAIDIDFEPLPGPLVQIRYEERLRLEVSRPPAFAVVTGLD